MDNSKIVALSVHRNQLNIFILISFTCGVKCHLCDILCFVIIIYNFFILLNRKRQHSGEAVKHTTTPASIHSQPSAAQDSDFVARRNLGHQLASPQVRGREGSPAGSAVSR